MTQTYTRSSTPVADQPLVLDLSQVNRGQLALVGGKAANLGELTQVDGA